MFGTFVVIACLLQASGTLGEALDIAHQDYMNEIQDQFADVTYAREFEGRSFSFVRSLKDGQEYGGGPSSAYYTYERGRLRLVFAANERAIGRDYGGPRYPVAPIGGNRELSRTYVGSNAYGASAEVNVYHDRRNAVAMLSSPVGEVSPYMSADSVEFNERHGIQISRDTYWLEIPVSGNSARELAHDTALVIEGSIGAFATGEVVHCESVYSDATIDSPTEVFGSECLMAANVTRVAFIRESTGEVIQEWLR